MLYTEFKIYSLAKDLVFEKLRFIEKIYNTDNKRTQLARKDVISIIEVLKEWREAESHVEKLVASLKRTRNEDDIEITYITSRRTYCLVK